MEKCGGVIDAAQDTFILVLEPGDKALSGDARQTRMPWSLRGSRESRVGNHLTPESPWQHVGNFHPVRSYFARPSRVRCC